jgi:hypothetical protein
MVIKWFSLFLFHYFTYSNFLRRIWKGGRAEISFLIGVSEAGGPALLCFLVFVSFNYKVHFLILF